MKTLIPVLTVAVIAGCSTAPITQEQREIAFIEQTSISQTEAFNRAVVYLAKNLGDSNFAIKDKNPQTGIVVTRIAVDCNDLRGFMDIINNYKAVFNLEFGAKDKKVRLLFEAVELRINDKSGPFIDMDKIETAKVCADREKESIMSAINAKRSDW